MDYPQQPFDLWEEMAREPQNHNVNWYIEFPEYNASNETWIEWITLSEE